MRSDRIGSDHPRNRSGRQRSHRLSKVPCGPASDAAQDDQTHCCGYLTESAEPALTLPCTQIGYAQARGYRFVGLLNKSLTQRLALHGVLRESCLLFGVRCEIDVDVLGAVVRQLSVDAGMQVVLFDRPTPHRRHLTLLSSAVRPS